MYIHFVHALLPQNLFQSFGYTYMLQKKWGEEGGVYSGPASDEQPARRRRGDSVWSLGLEEIRPETHQGLALPKVHAHIQN